MRLWGAFDLRARWHVAINPRMRTRAAVAWLDERLIELNPTLLGRHPERIPETLAHELAHLVVWHRKGRDAWQHGAEWMELMEQAGFEPARLHRMEVADLRRSRRRFYYLHVCTTCGSWWIARRQRSDRLCTECGPGEVHVFRTEATDAGLRALVARGKRGGLRRCAGR